MQGPARRGARATAVAVLLLVALAAAAMVRGEPAGAHTEPVTLAVGDVLAAVERVGLLIGVVVLVVLIGLLVMAVRSGQAPARGTDSRSLLRRTVALVLLVYVVALVATRVLPRLLASTGGGPASADEAEALAANGDLDGVLWPLVVLLAVAAVALAIVWLTRSPRDAADPAGEVRMTAASALARLEAGEAVDDVVLDAYRRLEQRLASAGIRRGTSETSTELLLRALRDVDVDAEAVRRLGALYERVRFGGLRPGEAERAEARAALAAIGAGHEGEVVAGG